MSSNRNRRLAKEIQDVQKDTHSGVTLEPVDSEGFDKLDHFYGVFKGTLCSVYAFNPRLKLFVRSSRHTLRWRTIPSRHPV